MKKGYFKQIISIILGVILISMGFIAGASPAQADDYFNCFETGSNSRLCPEPVLVNSCLEAPGSGKPRCCDGATKDYDISVSNKKSDVTVLAIHGGGIEANTSKISQDLATPRQWNRYTLSAHGSSQCLLGKSNFKRLHITSTNFNHQTALDLVKAHPKSIAIHGYSEGRNYKEGVICVGGKNQDQIKAFINYVNANSSTFTRQGGYKLYPINAPQAISGDCIDPKPSLKGTDSSNIVNKNSKGKGLQLELSPTMREDLVDKTEQRYETLRNIIYKAIDQAMSI